MVAVRNRMMCAAAALLVLLSLTGCGKQPEPTQPTEPEAVTLPVPTQDTTPTEPDPAELVEEITAVMEAGELYTLEHYPNLKRVDLSGSTCYEAILAFMEKNPHIDVTYTVNVGGVAVSNDATHAVNAGNAVISNKDSEAELTADSFTYSVLLENLRYLPNLQLIRFPEIPLDAAQVTELLETYPNLTLSYTLELLGSTYDADTQRLDLTELKSSQVEDVTPKLGLLTNLTDVDLSDGLSLEAVAKLQDANPNATFHYSFSLFGKTLSTTDEEVVYKNQNIGNEGEEDLRRALAVMDNCKRFVLDNCKLDNEVLASIREDFRGGPKVIWRVYFGVDGRYNTLTDDDTIRAVYNVTDKTCGPMKYLEDVKYMDLGHNEYLTDFSFVGYMPQLEVLIGSGSAVSDLSGIENCKKLTWLELASCSKLKDITPLAGCEGLKYLNLSFTGVKDYMPLDGLPLERFVCLSPKASTEEQNIFISIHPKDTCITVFYGYSNPYGYGWRYDDNGKTMFWYYKDVIREVFNYDQADAILDAQKKAAGK